MRFKRKLAIINSRRVYYWEKGEGQKQVLILLHGFPGNHRVVQDAALAIKNFRIIIPDLPACGQSESLPTKHTLKNYTTWLNNFLKALDIKNPVIAGYSFGGRIAITFASLFPQRLSKLILITPVAKVDSFVGKLASIEYKAAAKLPIYMKEAWLKNRIYRGISNLIVFQSSKRTRRLYLIKNSDNELNHLYPNAHIELFSEFEKAKPISFGKKISTKTLIIAADKDLVATTRSIDELCKRFSNHELVTVKNSGHILIGERPIKTANIINHWLAQN